MPSGKSTTRSSPWVPHRQPEAKRGWLESDGGATLKTPESEKLRAEAIQAARTQSTARPTAPKECHISPAAPRLPFPAPIAYERSPLPIAERIARLPAPGRDAP